MGLEDIKLLSGQQSKAVNAKSHVVFIEAAPGTGKTLVSAARFGLLARRHNSRGRGVLGLCFTTKAVGEFRDRVRRIWGNSSAFLPNEITTLDEIYRRMLRVILGELAVDVPISANFSCVDDYADVGAAATPVIGQEYFKLVLRDGKVEMDSGRIASRFHLNRAFKKYGSVFSSKEQFEKCLSEGYLTYRDVSRLVNEGMQHPLILQTLVRFIEENYSAIIVDECFDMNKRDLELIRAFECSVASVTLVGDPWQGIYEWRDADPKQVYEDLRTRPSLEKVNLSSSYRFSGDMIRCSRNLRSGASEMLQVVSAAECDVVLSPQWRDLLFTENEVLPKSFGKPKNSSHEALLEIILDGLLSLRLGERALYASSALQKLGIHSPRDADRLFGKLQRGLLRAPAHFSGSGQLELLAEELVQEFGLEFLANPSAGDLRKFDKIIKNLQASRVVLGLSIYQAKGLEWRSVGLRISENSVTSFRNGLQREKAHDRKLYVAATRAKEQLGLVTERI